MNGSQYRVIRPHRGIEASPLIARAGDRFKFDRRETEWAGWIWCTDGSGRSGWVPEAWVSIERDSCVMKRDYSSRELSVELGDEVTVNLVESSWAWVSDAHGQTGWVPLECLVQL